MREKFMIRAIIASVLLVVVSLACGASPAFPEFPTFPPAPPTPSTSDVQTGSSPLSGDWNAKMDWGTFAFTVDPDGKNVTTAVVHINGLTCGGTTYSTEIQMLNSWAIDNDAFQGYVNLKSGHIVDLYLDGNFNKAKKMFGGTWEADFYGTHCTGKWESAPHK